ncbi:MAG TPA: hypothetical protein ENO08_06710 [Candidatus Eisenbacteria bacterium]|uniref:eRF1 domain-containing protein n=1 Tax=Eiseniibacteriota bacterium TaxID=2212470 RepID=A0A7V2F472_UNCEI|nr:hypothetical protein [Candidatus Eisenbacteria bacterium]
MKHMMDRKTLGELASVQGGICLSIFMPMYPAPPENRQNHIRFKNLVNEAERRCVESRANDAETKHLLGPLRNLLEDPFFWLGGHEGLALYRSSGLFRLFHLPHSVEEACIVSERFHLKPILPLVGNTMPFFLLALDLGESKLFRCDRFGMEQMRLENTPVGLDDALRYDDPEQQLQFHTGTPQGPGKRAAIFHGQGVGVDDAQHKSNIRRFFTQLQKGIHAALKSEEAPLVLAGVEYLHPLYAETNQYPHLIDAGVHGSPSRMTDRELHRKALQLAETVYERRRREALERYDDLAGTSRATADMEEIVKAAFFGRVETLIAAEDRSVRGGFDPAAGMVTVSKEAKDDLIDLAATQTLLHGGDLFMAASKEMPGGRPLSALLRY